MTVQAQIGFAEALRRGIEERDAEAIAALYAEHAMLRLVDRCHPPSSPLELHGRGEIAEFYRDLCSRDMTHRLEQLVLSESGAAFTETCEYPDGTRVLCAALLELRDGLITGKTGVQAWDEEQGGR